MSLVVGFHLEKYVMLGADTRVVCYPPGESMQYRDDREKISKTSLGLISGTGLTSLLDAVKDRLNEEEIESTEAVAKVIEEERAVLRRDDAYHRDERVRHGVDHTAWLFSYYTFVDGSPYIRLGLCTGDSMSNVSRLVDNSAIVLFPWDIDPQEARAITDGLQKLVKPLSQLPDLVENIRYHVGVVSALMHEIAGRFDTVSRTFQVGVQTIDLHSGISPVIDGDGSWSFDLKGPSAE